MKKMKRVEITRSMVGICHMQVCVEKGATNAEILRVCNSENPSGTSNGWSKVIRGKKAEGGPVQCQDHKGRTHLLVSC